LTAVPLPLIPADQARPPGRAAAYYALVGLVLGFVLVGTVWLLNFFFPPQLSATVLLLVWAGFTGMLHLDGFMDACDGLLPPRDPAQRLEIMADSRVGAFGVVGVVLLLLLKFSGLVVLITETRYLALMAVPVLARWAMTWAMARYPVVRAGGLAEFFRRGLGWPQLVVASAVALIVAIGWLGVTGLVLVAVTWLITRLVAGLAEVRLGGLTGDIYGTICEVAETALLLTLVALINWGLV
jgi:adenosylcobinamide-GDP ribazoletransferase